MAEYGMEALERVVRARLAEEGEGSYTRRLAAGGVEACAQKLGEEAVEAVIAAVRRAPDELTREAADVVYHLTVLLAVSNLSWRDVTAELARRSGTSGLAEKAAREP
ncbi:phosphoribosyl-ATP diphosphatase [Acuticoccus sp.]|uniref:phosphoribosyl-ATP diphosphatase n=1 Tax=Acuticoccus sp. TaxID=1904378 RepID=UPI003B515BFC